VVEIRSIAREPGERAKVAVSATQSGIDPVGACVGIRGVRIQAIVRELHDEKIDVIEWNPDPAVFIAKAISPARVSGVYLNEQQSSGKTATVVVPEDQLSLAIGRDGQNARLAAKLTGWRIDIKSLPEAAADALYKLQKDESLAELAAQESETMRKVEDMLARKAEGRPLQPEEYDLMARFVDRVERRITRRPEAEKVSEDQFSKAKALVPADSFNINILDSGLPEHVAYILQEAGYSTLGEMAVQMKIAPDEILRLNGIGPRAMQEITRLMEKLDAQMEAEKAAQTAVEEMPQPSLETIEAAEVIKSVTESAPELVAELKPFIEEVKPELEVEAPNAEVETESTIEEPVEEEEPSFEQIFDLKLAPVNETIFEDEEESEGIAGRKEKKKGKKKKKHTQIEYDPDRDTIIVRKKHRRGDGGWDWDE